MRVALINGTSKITASNSEILLDDLASFLPEKVKKITCRVIANEVPNRSLSELQRADTWVVAFPLFVDGIPGHFLSFLHRLHRDGFGSSDTRIYAIVNNGFIEGEQAQIALSIMENWCKKTGCTWCGGIGVGGGPALKGMKNLSPTKGPKKEIGFALFDMAQAIVNKEVMKNQYVSIGLPRAVYTFAAERSWKKQIKTCGLKKEDLDRRL